MSCLSRFLHCYLNRFLTRLLCLIHLTGNRMLLNHLLNLNHCLMCPRYRPAVNPMMKNQLLIRLFHLIHPAVSLMSRLWHHLCRLTHPAVS
jgi:hypothetical protein